MGLQVPGAELASVWISMVERRLDGDCQGLVHESSTWVVS
jgi:hypothetical protein